MKVIVFFNSENTAKNQLISILEAVTQRKDIEKFTSITDLSKRLKIDTSDVSIILLSISGHRTLNELLTIRNQLIGHRIIIILPDQKNETLSKAHLLYPRFISYNDNNFEDLKAVVEKMLAYLNVHSKIKKLQDLDYHKIKSPNQFLLS